MQPVISHCDQGSQEWHDLRKGRMTASHAQEIATASKGLNTYCNKIAFALYTGKSAKSYQSRAMEQGIINESLARIAYEMTTGDIVQQVGFGYISDFAGSSPDGLVDQDGGIEIKCRENDEDSFSEIHGKLLIGDEVFEEKYIWQCHMNIYIFDRSWWDLVSYDPSYRDKSLLIQRIFRDEDRINRIKNGLEKGEKLIAQKLNLLQCSTTSPSP